MAAYKKEKDKFELLWEQKGDLDYSISENKIVLDKKKEREHGTGTYKRLHRHFTT